MQRVSILVARKTAISVIDREHQLMLLVLHHRKFTETIPPPKITRVRDLLHQIFDAVLQYLHFTSNAIEVRLQSPNLRF